MLTQRFLLRAETAMEWWATVHTKIMEREITMRKKTTSVAAGLASLVAIIGVTPVDAAKPHARDQQVRILAEKMCCKGCAQKISGQLYAARGVKSVEIDLKAHTIAISLPQPNATALGQLWHIVEQGNGGPTQLVTPEATYTLVPPRLEGDSSPATQPVDGAQYIVVEHLERQDLAENVGKALYALKGVANVSVDRQRNTLIVQPKQNASISPWLVLDAVARANARPLGVSGNYGTLSIEWATRRGPRNNQQAQQPISGGIQR